MMYFRAWYRREGDKPPPNLEFSDWVVYATDEADAVEKVLANMGRTEPERGFKVYLTLIPDEDEGTVALALARQNGQAVT